ncbi:hypothetical protein B9T66_07220 [Helicobacter sp. TUL]|uniref:outer membrane family protein n=1 Tax=Helicobacter sp. TUL TaxID=1848928 RepID=UPI000BAB8A2C|nr:outer membrane family protein [Helicobacter sp. TUL]PAU99474.1 hypothetical protein B9T66_07220 [Helicobacter sp. TUL]
MKIKYSICMALVCGFGLCAQDSIESTRDNGFFYTGGMELYNKNATTLAGSFPNNTYGYALGQLNVGYKHNGFEIVLGGAGAGLTHDSTKGLAFNHVGYWSGYRNDLVGSQANAHNIFVHNAYMRYEDENIDIKLGRFKQENDDWIDAYVEGMNAIVRAGGFHLKLFCTSGIAFAGGGWFMDYERLFSTYGILNAEVGYANEHVKFDTYVYYGDREYIAPGANLEIYAGDSDMLGSTTKLTALFPIHNKGINSLGRHYFANFGDGDSSGFSASLVARQDFDFLRHYNVSLAVYKNIGNANARMGQPGNPLGFYTLDNSVYSTGPALNAFLAPDAFSALFFSNVALGATKAGNFVFGLDGRYTTAPSAREHALKLHVDWEIDSHLTLGLIATYYISTPLEAGVWALNGESYEVGKALDRSYVISQINYNF